MTVVDQATAPQPATMPLTAHLAELRNRILWIIVAISAGGAVGCALGPQIITLLRSALPPDVRPVEPDPAAR